MNKVIAIVDCNNFYASCERVFNPKLIGKPIVVLSNNDGMIIARSNEAKALGIQMGEPLFKIKEIVKKHNVQVFSSNYMLYGDLSHRVMTTLEQFSPDVEIYSIDEAFLSLEGFKSKDIYQYCCDIKKTIKQWTGIPVSIGISNTKTLAKIANRYAKKKAQYNGVLKLLEPNEIDEILKNTEVEDIWGVGRQYTKLLKLHNIHTAFDLKNANDNWIRKKMTVMGLRTVYELRGNPCISLEYTPAAKQSIVTSRSFSTVTNSMQDIMEAISTFTAKAAEKMRYQDSAARLLTVFLRTNPFKDIPQYHNGVLIELPTAIDSTSELLHYAKLGVEQIFKPEYFYHKVGIMLSGFIPNNQYQATLFDTVDRDKLTLVSNTVDRINMLMGANTVFYASMGIKRDWKTKAELKSPRYTTSWDELFSIDCDKTIIS